MADKAAFAPNAATIMSLAQAAVARLPDAFREHLRDVVIRVEDFADEEILRELGLDSEWDLTGLYQGRPMSEQAIWSSGELRPTISLFRVPLLSEWVETGVSLEELVNHVIVHEVGHHFGLSDDEMHAIENDRS